MESLDSRLLYVKELRHFSAVCLSFETACNWQTEALASVIFFAYFNSLHGHCTSHRFFSGYSPVSLLLLLFCILTVISIFLSERCRVASDDLRRTFDR